MNRRIACLAALAGATVLNGAFAAQITIRSDEWFPYNGAPGDAQEGYMIDAAREIAIANGHIIDYRLSDWDASIEAARGGTIDCVVGAAHDDAPELKFPSAPWGVSNNAFFVMAESTWTYRDTSDLPKVRLAHIKGYAYTEEINGYIAKAEPARLVEIADSRAALSKAMMYVVTGKADTVIEDEAVGLARLKKLDLLSRVRVAGRTSDSQEIFIACTPAKPEGEAYAKMFDDGLRKLRSSGELAKILGRYGLRDWTAAR
jgi:polar amino acid transport system substrate-binding protein